MISFLISLLLKAGVPAKWHKPILVGLGIVFLVGTSVAVVKCHDANVIEENNLEVNLEAEKGGREADAKAATKRLNDELKHVEDLEDYYDAIETAPEGIAPDPASVALACERLRKAGENTTSISACR